VDHAWAKWIAWQLQAAGYTVVLQAWHFDPGTNLIDVYVQHLRKKLGEIGPALIETVRGVGYRARAVPPS